MIRFLRSAGVLIGLITLVFLAVRPARAATVVGSGTPGSCNEPALVAAVAEGGAVTFDCGDDPVSIPLTARLIIAPNASVTIDGGGLVTLKGDRTQSVLVVGQQASLSLSNLTVTDGGASAIQVSARAQLALSGSTVSNSFGDQGGAISALESSVVSITNSTLSGNKGGEGGAIHISDARLTLTNSTLSGNTSKRGGGLHIESSQQITHVDIINTTIANNSVYAVFVRQGNPSVTVVNSIFFGNGVECSQPINSGSNNLFGDNSCGAPKTADPRLGALADNGGLTETISLLAGSPAINAADPKLCPPADQRWRGRLGSCDIGAFEFGASVATVTPTPVASHTPTIVPTSTLVPTDQLYPPTATPSPAPIKPSATLAPSLAPDVPPSPTNVLLTVPPESGGELDIVVITTGTVVTINRFEDSVKICLSDGGIYQYLDSAGAPIGSIQIITSRENGLACSTIINAGSVTLISR